MTDIENPETAPSTDEPAVQEQERPQEYIADISFDELGLSDELRKAVAERGYKTPTPVQAKAFPSVVAGRDVIVRSKTGTGKTAAFGLPLLQRIPSGERQVKALILCPTRELAIQVGDEITALAKYKDLKVATIYGGASMKAQEDALEFGSAIVVGTPGRVADHIRRKNLKLESCTHVVLDEADEMLNQGFYEDVTAILDLLPKTRQVLLFSATIPPDIEKLIAQYTREAETLLLSGDVFTVDHIHHVRYDVSDEYPKPRNLVYVLEMENPDNAIIFCNTRDDTTLVTAVLNRNGFDAEVLNGDLPQKERERVMGKVKRGEVAFMVATDIAARGIDISDLGHVINYSLPEDPAVYLHRVGRTGRIGKKGTAINLISGRELGTLTVLEKQYKISFEKRAMPLPEQAATMWTERHVREIREVASQTIYDGYLALAGQLRQRPDADDLVAFLLKYFFTQHRIEKARAAGREEAPVMVERPSRSEGRDRDRGERRRDRERDGRREREREERPERAARGDREERQRRDRHRSESVEPTEGEVKLWMNLGRADGFEDEAALKAGLTELGVDGARILRSDVRPTFSYVIVPEAEQGNFEALSGKTRGEKALKVERSRERGERSPRSERTERPAQPSGAADASVAEAIVTAEAAVPASLVESAVLPSADAAAPAAEPALAPGEAKLWVNLGRQEKLDDAGFIAALEAAGAPAGTVKSVEVRGTYSYCVVDEAHIPAYEGLNGKLHGEKALKIERSRERTARPPRRERSEKRSNGSTATPVAAATPAPPAPKPSLAQGQVRIYVNLGRADGLDEGALRSALEELGAPKGSVQGVELRGTFAYAHVGEGDASAVEALAGKTYREKTLKVERARV